MCTTLYLYHNCTHQTYDSIKPCSRAKRLLEYDNKITNANLQVRVNSLTQPVQTPHASPFNFRGFSEIHQFICVNKSNPSVDFEYWQNDGVLESELCINKSVKVDSLCESCNAVAEAYGVTMEKIIKTEAGIQKRLQTERGLGESLTAPDKLQANEPQSADENDEGVFVEPRISEREKIPVAEQRIFCSKGMQMAKTMADDLHSPTTIDLDGMSMNDLTMGSTEVAANYEDVDDIEPEEAMVTPPPRGPPADWLFSGSSQNPASMEARKQASRSRVAYRKHAGSGSVRANPFRASEGLRTGNVSLHRRSLSEAEVPEESEYEQHERAFFSRVSEPSFRQMPSPRPATPARRSSMVETAAKNRHLQSVKAAGKQSSREKFLEAARNLHASSSPTPEYSGNKRSAHRRQSMAEPSSQTFQTNMSAKKRAFTELESDDSHNEPSPDPSGRPMARKRWENVAVSQWLDQSPPAPGMQSQTNPSGLTENIQYWLKEWDDVADIIPEDDDLDHAAVTRELNANLGSPVFPAVASPSPKTPSPKRSSVKYPVQSSTVKPSLVRPSTVRSNSGTSFAPDTYSHPVPAANLPNDESEGSWANIPIDMRDILEYGPAMAKSLALTIRDERTWQLRRDIYRANKAAFEKYDAEKEKEQADRELQENEEREGGREGSGGG